MDLPVTTPTHQAATFEERGVFVPFTTPALAGVRVRRDVRHGLVLVVPNPSGGRGVYVLPWAGVRDMCHPTLHDGMLHDALATATNGVVTPATVLAAARRVALDGAAGRAAHTAATAALQAESASRQATNSHLLFALAARPGLQSNLSEIAAIAAVIDEIGVGPAADRAGMPLRLARLRALREELSAWSHMTADDTGCLSMTIVTADLSIRCAENVLTAARNGVADIDRLMAHWRSRPQDIALLAGRAAWVLDGWDLPCLLWNAASGVTARRCALGEIGHMLSILPKEAEVWTGTSIDAEAGQALRRMVGSNQDWRTGLNSMDLVVRNEQFRALAA